MSHGERGATGVRGANHRPRWSLACAVLTMLFAVRPAPMAAQDMEVPSDQQLALITRIPSFDRAFRERVGDEVVVGIVYQTTYRPSVNAMSSMLAAVRAQGVAAVSTIPSRFVRIDLENGESVQHAIVRHEVDIAYVAPLRGVNLRRLLGTCRDYGVITFTGVRAYVEDGIAVAIGMRGGKPEIIVNLTESRASGADFSAPFLRMATVVP